MLKFLKQRLAIWRAVLFFSIILISGSCKDDRLLGLDVLPDGSLDHLQLIDTLTIESYSFMSESQRSDNYRNFVGKLNSPEFGTSSSNWAFNLTSPSEAVTVLENIEDTVGIDSVVLYIRPVNVYGDITENLEIEVYELAEALDDTAYFSDTNLTLNPLPIATETWSFESHDDFLDTTVIVTDSFLFKIGVSLPNSIGSRLLKGSGRDYTDSESLQRFFKGLMIKVSENYQPAGNGALYDFITSSVNSFVQVFYTVEEEDGTTSQYFVRYPINNSSLRVNEQSNDPSGSLLDQYLQDPSKTDDLLFVQGLSGSKAQINIPHLNNLGENTLLAVSKATLTVPVASEQPTNFDRSSKLYLLDVQYDESNNDSAETLTLDYVFSTTRHGGFLVDDEYVFDVTRQIQQALLDANAGNNSNYGFRLNAQVPIINGNVRDQNILKGSENIVLRIYYTDISN